MCIWYIQYQNFNLIYIYVSTLYIYIPNTYKFYLILYNYYISTYKSILSSFGSPSEIIPLRSSEKPHEAPRAALQVSSGERIVLDGERRRGERLHTMRGGTVKVGRVLHWMALFWCFLLEYGGDIWWEFLFFRIFDNLSISIRWMAGSVGS